MEFLAAFVVGILVLIVLCAVAAWGLAMYGSLVARLLDAWAVPRAWGCRALVGFGFLLVPAVVLIVLGHVVGGAR